MSLRDLLFLYAVSGLACAVAIYRSAEGSRSRALGAAALAVPLWPLWAPIALTSARKPSGPWASGDSRDPRDRARSSAGAAALRVEAALREGVEACAGTSLEALLPSEAAARIASEVRRAADRHAELTEVLGRDGFDVAAAQDRVASLEREGASGRALATARLHLENVKRLAALRDRDERALGELADLVQALRTQLVLARFAGSSVEGAGGIVSEVWARVEGLGAALGSDDDDREPSEASEGREQSAPREP
jgi:hypothetical protein